jgi:nucleoside-diphosphate-sugar epimerase
MVRAFDLLVRLPVLPLRPDDRIDIVPADYVGAAMVKIHQMDKPNYGIYHLSSGASSQTYRELTDALAVLGGWSKPSYQPWLRRPFSGTVNWLASRGGAIGYRTSLLKVFWPYLDWNTVFDNSRVTQEMAGAPAKFSSYAYPLLQFCRKNKFSYPAKAWPAAVGSIVGKSAGSAVA